MSIYTVLKCGMPKFKLSTPLLVYDKIEKHRFIAQKTDSTLPDLDNNILQSAKTIAFYFTKI